MPKKRCLAALNQNNFNNEVKLRHKNTIFCLDIQKPQPEKAESDADHRQIKRADGSGWLNI